MAAETIQAETSFLYDGVSSNWIPLPLCIQNEMCFLQSIVKLLNVNVTKKGLSCTVPNAAACDGELLSNSADGCAARIALEGCTICSVADCRLCYDDSTGRLLKLFRRLDKLLCLSDFEKCFRSANLFCDIAL